MRYNTRCYFNVHMEPKNTQWKKEKVHVRSKQRICSEVSVIVRGIRAVSPDEEEEGYGGKNLQKRKVLSLE